MIKILNKSFEDNIEISKGQLLNFFVGEPENLKSQHHVPIEKKGKKGKEKLYLENEKGRREAFGTAMTLHIQIEMWLTKQLKLRWVRLKGPQTILTIWQNRESIK